MRLALASHGLYAYLFLRKKQGMDIYSILLRLRKNLIENSYLPFYIVFLISTEYCKKLTTINFPNIYCPYMQTFVCMCVHGRYCFKGLKVV